jgi:hypothetical protein
MGRPEPRLAGVEVLHNLPGFNGYRRRWGKHKPGEMQGFPAIHPTPLETRLRSG